MKIVIDARFWGAEDTGLGRYTQNLVKELARIDQKNPYLLLTRGKSSDFNDLPANFKVISGFAHPYSFRGQIQVSKALFFLRPDVVHVPHGGIPLFFKGKLVLTVHDLIKLRWAGQASTTRSAAVHWLKLACFRFLFNLGVRKAAVIIVPSDFVKSQLEKKSPGVKAKTWVVHEGVDRAYWQTSAKDEEAIMARYQLSSPFIIYTGNLYPYKNVPMIIKAVGLARKEIHNLVLAIVCARSIFSQRLLEVVKEEESQGLVKFLGFVSDQDLAGLYRKALAFVSASQEEGFGITPVEALAAGGSVVLARIPTFKEVCGDLAYYFDPNDPSDLARVLVELHRGKVSKKGQLKPDQYTWEKMAQEIKMIYKEVGYE